jgi:iron complex transport system substrate-binding protein
MSSDRPSQFTRRLLLAAVPAVALAPALSAFAAAGPRIVSLDNGLASTLLGLGVTPIGIGDRSSWDKWVAEPALPPQVVDLGVPAEPNLEVLAALKPDFILTTPYLDAQLSRLREFGTVLRYNTFIYEGTPILDMAIDVTRQLAGAIGRVAEGERFLEEMEAHLEGCRQRLASVSPPAVALVYFMDPRHARVYGAPSLFNDVLGRIGVANAWPEPSNQWGFQGISIDELSRITDPAARLIAFEPIPPDLQAALQRSPLWQHLPIAQAGRFSTLPPALSFGMVNEAMRFAGLLTDLLERAA